MSVPNDEALQRLKAVSLDTGILNAFYSEYISLFEDCSDAPTEFILTSLLPSLGAAISSSRWISWGNKNIYPNIWTMLVGPSTLVRKSTSINIGLHFNNERDVKQVGRSYILPNDGSFAALLAVLEREKQGVLKHSEVASLIEGMGKGYNNNMKSLFTDFFDVPGVHKIHLKGEEDLIIERPIFSMATGTTINWLKQNITRNDCESGFLARFLFCVRDRRKKSIAVPAVPDPKKMEDMRKTYDIIFSLPPSEITLDASYKEVYTAFHGDVERLFANPLLDTATKSLLSRLQTDYFLKLTIIECVLGNTVVATALEAERVRSMMEYYIGQAISAMDQIMRTERSKSEVKVLEYLRERGRASSTDLYHLFHNNIHTDNLNTIMKALMDAGLVRSGKDGKTKYYEPVSDS